MASKPQREPHEDPGVTREEFMENDQLDAESRRILEEAGVPLPDWKPTVPNQHQERFVVREMLPNKPGLFAIWDRQLRHYPNSDRDREKLQLVCDILNEAQRDGTLAKHGLSVDA